MRPGLLLVLLFSTKLLVAQSKGDEIIGKWISDKGNLVLQVYKNQNEYRAKAIYHRGKDTDEKWVDDKNSDPALKNRKLIGTDLLTQLHYDPNNNDWNDGLVYDPTSGKTFEAIVTLADHNTLRVKGYWLIRAFNKVKVFTRIK